MNTRLPTLLLCILGLALSSCEQKSNPAATAEQIPFAGVSTFQQLDTGTKLKLISASECEITSEGKTVLATYSKQASKLRVVVKANGSDSVLYFENVPQGLRVEGDERIFLDAESVLEAQEHQKLRNGCVINMRNIQQVIRASQNLSGFKEGEQIIWSSLIGPGQMLEKMPTCPVHGKYRLVNDYPGPGKLAAECPSLSSPDGHRPDNFSEW